MAPLHVCKPLVHNQMFEVHIKMTSESFQETPRNVAVINNNTL